MDCSNTKNTIKAICSETFHYNNNFVLSVSNLVEVPKLWKLQTVSVKFEDNLRMLLWRRPRYRRRREWKDSFRFSTSCRLGQKLVWRNANEAEKVYQKFYFSSQMNFVVFEFSDRWKWSLWKIWSQDSVASFVFFADDSTLEIVCFHRQDKNTL